MAAHVSVPNRPRLLSVTGSYYDYQLEQGPPPREVPLLRLRGYWLRQAGFEVGQRVLVRVTEQCITIVPAHTPKD
jgi:toxic protein SymE